MKDGNMALTRFDAHQSAENGSQSITGLASITSCVQILTKLVSPASKEEIMVFSCRPNWHDHSAHRAEGLVNPKVRAKKRLLILDTPEHVD
jgi:hypothetical protein